MPEPLIRARDLAKVYRSGDADLVIFSGLSLDVERGEMLCLVENPAPASPLFCTF